MANLVKVRTKVKSGRRKSKSKSSVKTPSIPLSRDEMFRLHDIAASLKLLQDVAEEAPELQLIQVEILIQKTSQCAWNLIHEELDGRWMDLHPDVDPIR